MKKTNSKVGKGKKRTLDKKELNVKPLSADKLKAVSGGIGGGGQEDGGGGPGTSPIIC